MKAPLVSCCAFFFSVPYPFRLKVVDALGHRVSPSDAVCSKGLPFTGWNIADLEGLLEHIFPSFLRSPRVEASLHEFPIENHMGSLLESQHSVRRCFMDTMHVDPAH